MKVLLSIAIGPVQDFITAARRTRDLWYGSWLLSELSRAAARSLPNAELIFPPGQPKDDDTVVNKILAELDNIKDEAEIRQMADECIEAVRNRLLHLASETLDKAAASLAEDNITLDRSRAEQQLRSVVEVYAAWQPRTPDYQADRRQVELRLAGRKALRNFAPHDGLAGRPKSSLDGWRESVLEHPEKQNAPPQQFIVRHKEQLDAIGLLKRYGRDEEDDQAHRFVSTIDVAAMPFVSRLRRTNPTDLATFERFVKHQRTRGDRRRLPSKYAYLYRHELREIKDEDLRSRLEKVVAPLRVSQSEPPYFALLLGDGDSMGKAIAQLATPDAHRQFAERLNRFAAAAGPIIDKHDGQCVYAGGDDVMAFLPIHEALACARELRAAFAKVAGDLAVRPTFSAGLAVAHAMEPLSEIRAMAAEAEATAKRFEDKDALSIVVAPRSGSPVAVTGHWDDLFVKPGLLPEVVSLYRAKKLSPGLRHAFAQLLADPALQQPEMDEAIPKLALAIAKRKRESEEAQKLVTGVATRQELQRLTQILHVARPFARAEREAFAP